MSQAPLMPEVSNRVRKLLESMSMEQKLAQLVGFWVDQPDDGVAPLQEDMVSASKYEEVTKRGIGHLTRVYGTLPVDPNERVRWLRKEQQRIRDVSGLGIGAIVHEECLTGLAAWQASTFPTPLAWGASFDPDLVEEMGRLIGEDMAELGIHQGLAPVLDVIRDPRWGRTEESISEDPYVVGTIGTAYVKGLQSSGIDATLKHFIGYSASVAGRNHAPARVGPRELADVLLLPFEMALLDGGACSVMNAYNEIDGEPVASSSRILTTLLREDLGFDGPVVADYYSVAFIELMHKVACGRADAAKQALEAGIDVELPTADVYPLLDALVETGELDVSYIDRAVLRVLAQKERHGLIDNPDLGFVYEGEVDVPSQIIDLDKPENRQVARRLAEESIVLLSNNGILPLKRPLKLAVAGPNADSVEPLMGCYSFVNHVLAHHPGIEPGFPIKNLFESVEEEFGSPSVTFVGGCPVEDPEGREEDFGADQDIFDAVCASANSDVIIVAVGDRSGLFGRGTVGEGNDVDSLELPGRQRRLVTALVETGIPVVMVLLTGRPYAIRWALDGESKPAAVVQAFFPGEEGGPAVANVLSGAINPSGRLPVSLPRSAGAQPFTYLHPQLGGATGVSSLDTQPVRPFGFGLSYTEFSHSDLEVEPVVAADGLITASVTVTNLGDRDGVDVVQLYGHDRIASVTRPLAQLLAYCRVDVPAKSSRKVTFTVPTTRLAFSDRNLNRVVEPGEVDLWVGSDCQSKETLARVNIVGTTHHVSRSDPRVATAVVSEPH